MRAWVLGISGLVLVALSGCDQVAIPGTQQQAQVAPPVAAPVAAPACNCTQQQDHLTRLSYVPRHTRHHYGYGSGYHGSYRSQSQQSVDSYGYVSRSSVSYSESSSYSSGDSYASGGYDANGHRYYGGRIAWVDGYGRGYYNSGPATVAQSMSGKRMHPWHGYDADCPDHERGPDGY